MSLGRGEPAAAGGAATATVELEAGATEATCSIAEESAALGEQGGLTVAGHESEADDWGNTDRAADFIPDGAVSSTAAAAGWGKSAGTRVADGF